MLIQNKDIEQYIAPGRHVHLVGIGGVSMRPLGVVLQGMGIHVTGSDMSASASTDELIAKGKEFDALMEELEEEQEANADALANKKVEYDEAKYREHMATATQPTKPAGNGRHIYSNLFTKMQHNNGMQCFTKCPKHGKITHIYHPGGVL